MPCVTTRTWWRSPDGPPEAAACGRGGGAGARHGGASSRTRADHAVTVGVQRRDVTQVAQGSAPPWVPDAPGSVCSSGPPGVLHGRHGGGRVPRGCGSHAVVGGSVLGRAAEPVKGPPARFGPGWRGRVPPERSVGRCRLLRSRPRLPEPPHGRPTGTAPTRGPVAGYGERPSPRAAGPAAISSGRAHGPSPTGLGAGCWWPQHGLGSPADGPGRQSLERPCGDEETEGVAEESATPAGAGQKSGQPGPPQ